MYIRFPEGRPAIICVRSFIMKMNAVHCAASALASGCACIMFLTACGKAQPPAVPQARDAVQASPEAKEGTPFIVRVSPAPKAVDVGIGDPVAVVFGRAMDRSTIEGSISVFGPNGKKLVGETTVSGQTVEFRTKELFEYSTVYTVVLDKKIRDAEGHAVSKGSSWTFTTNNGVAPKIRVKNNGSIILSDITGYDYYSQDANTKSPPVEFTVTNEGNADLVIWSLGFVSGEKDQFSLFSPQYPVTLHPGESSAFSVVFHPASKGKKTVFLKIRSNDANFGFFNLMVTGTGV